MCVFCLPHLFLRCCTLPRQRNLPLTMMAILVQSASHSSMLHKQTEQTTCCSSWRAGKKKKNSAAFLFKILNSIQPVRRQDDGASLFNDAQDCVPQSTPSFRVHPCCRFILGGGKQQLFSSSCNRFCCSFFFFFCFDVFCVCPSHQKHHRRSSY